METTTRNLIEIVSNKTQSMIDGKLIEDVELYDSLLGAATDEQIEASDSAENGIIQIDEDGNVVPTNGSSTFGLSSHNQYGETVRTVYVEA